jgi:diaminopimelate decarboxylase
VGEGVLIPGFARTDGALACEGVPLDAIAAAAGTPVYVYSAGAIRDAYERLRRAFAPVPHRVHYSVKANSNLAVLRLLREMGAGVDIVSGGELFRVQRAGYAGADIVFSGVGKTETELREALRAGVLMVNVESESELRLLSRIAGELKIKAPIALRVNPEVEVDTHSYITTGERGNKFGIPFESALDVAKLALSLPNIALLGLDMHIGSQLSDLEPYREGLGRLLELHAQIKKAGARDVKYCDIGGGLAVTYDTEMPMDVQAFANAVLPLVAATGLTLLVEPGRFLVGNSGVLLSRVLVKKHSGGHEYVIIDAGMNDLLRPSHYNAFHHVEAVRPRPGRATVDVVGPVCESGDFVALERDMDMVEEGDLVAIRSAGAYGFVMSSNYNARPRAAEVLVDGDRFAIVTARERYEDLVRLEPLAPDWRTP